MEEDNLFGEIDDFLNTSTDAYSGTVNNDTNPSNTGPPPPAPSHQIVQSNLADQRTSEANRMTAATKAALGEKLRNNLQSHGGGGEKRKLDAVEGPGGGDDGSLGGGDGCEMAKAQKFDGDGSVDDEFAAFINSPASGAPNSSQSEKGLNPPIAIKDGISMQNQGGGPAAPPGGLLAQALTERKPSNQSGNYALNNFGPMGGAGGSSGFQQETQNSARIGKQDPLVERTLSALKMYKNQPEQLKRVFNENPDMRAVFNQIKQAQMVQASHGQYNTAAPTVNLQRTANPRTMLPVQQQQHQQQQQFVGNGVGMTETQWNAQPMPSKVSPPIQRAQTHQGSQFVMEPQQQMYVNQHQPQHHQDLWMVGEQMYSGVPPNRGVMPQPPQPQQHHHQMGHPGPPPYPYGRANVDSGVRVGYPAAGVGGAPQHQGDFPGSAAFTRYQPHPGNGALNAGQRHLPPQPQPQPPMPPMGSPNGIRMGYDEGAPIQMMAAGGVRQNMMSGVGGVGAAAALRHENMAAAAAAAAARGRLSAAGGQGMVRSPLPPTQLGSPKGLVRRQQQQDISPPQYQLQHQQQQHEIVNGALMNGGNYQVVGGGGSAPVYNLYQNQSTHPLPYNDPHQQQLNERALGIDKFMMQQQQHLPPNGNGNEPGNGFNDSFNKPMTSSSVSSSSNPWKMNAEEHRKIMLSNLHMALREQNDPHLLSMVDSVEAEAFLQCDTQSQYDYRLATWLAAVLDKAKTMTHETATMQLTTGGVHQQQQQHVSAPPMPSSLSDGQPPTESVVTTSVAVAGSGGVEEGRGGSTEGGNCAGGSNRGNFSESSLSVKNPILANLLPSKSGSDAGDNGASDNNEVSSLRLEDGKASVNSNVSSMSTAAAGPITALTPPSSSESLPSSSPPQTTMASPSPRATVTAAAGPVVKYTSSSKKLPAESPFSSSSSSSLSAPSSNATTASSTSTSTTSFSSSSAAAPTTISTVASSSSSSSSSVMSTFQSPSSSSSSTFSVPSTAERQVASAAGAAGSGGGSSSSSNINNNSGGRRTSSGPVGAAPAATASNGMMNKSGNTNPHSVDSGIGSPPRSITSSSLYSPKIPQGTPPSLAAISSDVGASPEK